MEISGIEIKPTMQARCNRMALSQQQKQRMTGYLFVVLAIVLAGNSILAFTHGYAGQAVFSLPLTVFLGYLAWRQLQSRTSTKRVTADERTIQTVQQASAQAFWILLVIMMIQTSFQIIPEGFITSGYILIGMITLGLFWGYYRWRGLSA